MAKSKAFRIVIMGRPNVGKSTLFNRLIGSRRALVHDMPGVTRDRIEHSAKWWVHRHEYSITLIDTGGVGGEHFAQEIEDQVGMALSSADAALIVFDAHAGVTTADQELMRKISRAGIHKRIPLFAIVNKVDAESHESLISDFFSLGLDHVLTISAEHARGIDDLKEQVIGVLSPAGEEDESESEEELTDDEASEEFEDVESEVDSEDLEDAEGSEEESEDSDEPCEDRIPRIAIVGQPNVGKSTLTNAILGESRMITSPIAGTTVDAVDSEVELSGKRFVLVDTAGIRRKSKTEQGIEVLSVVQAKKALERADLAILLLDGERGTTEQDEKIGGMIEEAGCSVILAINKWDTQRKNPKFTKEMAAERIRGKMAYLKYAPIMFLSAKEGRGFEDLGDLASDILHQRQLKIPTHEFTEWVRREATVHNPMNAKFYMCHQAGRNPPTFVCHVSDPDKVHFSLRRHLINALRERWGFMGSPVRMLFVQGKSTRAAKRPPAAR
ncbi:MAG: ribosome biogenesis GTPase Der [Bdellovibrionia bacterium]